MSQKRGQSTLEYIILIIIIIAVFISMSSYFKRGIQGRWRNAADDFGDQYDPRVANSSVRHTFISNSETQVRIENTGGGFYTIREDKSSSIEKKNGEINMGSTF